MAWRSRATEREASGLLRSAALPRSRLEKARSAVAAVMAELEEAQEEEREAIARAKDSAAEVKCATSNACTCFQGQA